jgi:hypothetical protein
MLEPLTPFATIPRPEDIAAYLEIARATEPEILPPFVAEAACDVSRLESLQTLAEETDDDA